MWVLCRLRERLASSSFMSRLWKESKAMSKQIPMLMESPLTKRVFVVTSYKDNGDGTFTARQKFDVTEQFDALAEQRKAVEQ